MQPYNQGIRMKITTKHIDKEVKFCMQSPPREEGIVQRVFFKFIPLFMILTFQIICQYPRLEST